VTIRAGVRTLTGLDANRPKITESAGWLYRGEYEDPLLRSKKIPRSLFGPGGDGREGLFPGVSATRGADQLVQVSQDGLRMRIHIHRLVVLCHLAVGVDQKRLPLGQLHDAEIA